MNLIMKKIFKVILFFPVLFSVLLNSNVIASGSFIDKVYHPYVQEGEREFEWRFNMQNDDTEENEYQHRFAYGQSINEHWFAEVYLITERNSEHDYDLSAIEIEALWQITEQGEYNEDWGMLFEVEHEFNSHVSEISSALIIEKEWKRWVGTANLYLIYEWGSHIDNELETAMSLQTRYRYSRSIQPAIEFYSSDASEGIGPVLLGDIKLTGRQKLHWEAGVIFALDNETADQTFKCLIEYEF